MACLAMLPYIERMNHVNIDILYAYFIFFTVYTLNYKLPFLWQYFEFVTGLTSNMWWKKGRLLGIGTDSERFTLMILGKATMYNKKRTWSHIMYEHRASFETFFMDPSKKKETMDDLVTFNKFKEYYARIEKALRLL